MRYVGRIEDPHRCDLPKRGPFWNRNALCFKGSVVQCEVCGKQYAYTYFGYSETWDWELLNEDRRLKSSW